MKIKEIIAFFIVTVLIFIQFTWVKINNNVYANDDVQETIATRYFFNQLTDEAKEFYYAMEKMLEDGSLKTGTANYDLVANNRVSQEQLSSYANGSQDLLISMGAARDAFVADHPDIFYVDFDYLTLRVTSKDGKYYATLGTGRGDSYRNKAFLDKSVEDIEKSISAVEKRVDEIVQEAKNIQVEENQNLVEQQVKYVHDQIIYNADYTYEGETKDGASDYNVRNVYGAFVANETGENNILDNNPETKANGQMVCEGYARAVKMVLDELNIPCILVTGIYKHTEEELEPHMWDYVQLEDGKWYAVDATFDDPSTGTEKSEYLLVGDDKVGAKHIPTGIMSESNYEFTYPKLQTVSDKFEPVYNTDGLVVELDDEAYDEEEDVDSGIFRISYKNMGYKAAAEKGYYIVANYYQYYPGTDNWIESGWGYLRTDFELYPIKDITDENGNSYLQTAISNCKYIQVAVTDIAPAPHNPQERDPNKIARETTYFGTPSSFIVMSDKIYNPNGDYVAPPYVKTVTPIVNSTLYIGSTYHVTVEYDDVLIPTDDEDIKMTVSVPSSPNNDLNKYYKVENFNFDGISTFSFDFTPSEMYEDDSVYYLISFKGVVGARSGKVPNDLSYFCAHRCDAYALRASQGVDWNVFGKPQLMENTDLSTKGWQTSDGETLDDLADSLKHRMALVAIKADESQVKEMNNVLSNDDKTGKDTVLSEETYNIKLTLCKKQVISTGQKVRVRLGFPPGYGPEDEGVTFKAYHFTKNDQGQIIDVEEIPVVVTKLGLIVMCDSFSPFTIAAVEEKNEEVDSTKTVVISETDGGTVSVNGKGDEKVITLEPEDEITININPNENYEIDEVVVGNKVKELENTITLNYNDLTEKTTMVKVVFATKNTHTEEKNEGLELVAQPITAQPTFTAKLTTSLKDSEKLVPGQEFTVTASIDTLTDVGEGLLAIGGKLKFDTSMLEFVNGTLLGSENWNLSQENYNIENFKFITDSNKYIKEPGEVFTIKFKVKDDAIPGETTSIQLTDLEGSAGIKDAEENIVPTNATASSTQISVDITNPIVEDKLTSSVYDIEEYYIKNVSSNTTVAKFKSNLEYSKEPVITKVDAEGKEVVSNDNDLVTTGTKVSVGENISCTIIILGDVDADGQAMKINDIGKIKTHYIGTSQLLGVYAMAADLNNNGKVDINDLAKMKLEYIGSAKVPEEVQE